jgi:hypothetical protein
MTNLTLRAKPDRRAGGATASCDWPELIDIPPGAEVFVPAAAISTWPRLGFKPEKRTPQQIASPR